MKIIIDIPSIPKSKSEHYEGILFSFFAAIDDILRKKRKGSYLIHFFLERLEKSERRELLLIFSKIMSQLQKAKNKENPHKITSSLEEGSLPNKFHKIIKSYQIGVSKNANSSHQDPNARSTPNFSEVIANYIVKEVKHGS